MNKINNKLLKDFILSQTTIEEERKLAQLLEDSEDNQKELFESELAYYLGKQDKYQTQDKLRSAEVKLFSAISKYEKEKNDNQEKGQRTRIVSLFRYAATFLILLTLTGGLYFYLSRSEEMITISATNGVKKINLPDHSIVWLNKGTKLSYSPNFNGEQRNVTLEGEALFHVAKNPNKPFIVKGKYASARVLGTTFNFKEDPNRGTEEVSLIEGRLEVSLQEGKEKVILQPNQKAIINRNKEHIETKNTYAPIDAVWRDNIIPFDNMSITEIAQIIEDVYGYQVNIDNNLDKTKTYTGVIRKSSDIKKVLDGLSYSLSFRYNINNRTIFLSAE